MNLLWDYCQRFMVARCDSLIFFFDFFFFIYFFLDENEKVTTFKHFWPAQKV